MTRLWSAYGDGTMVEVRLDAGKAPRLGASARPKGGFDAPSDTQHAISRCSKRPKSRSFPRNEPESGGCRSKACRQAGIDDLRFHDLRHEATSRLFENTDLRDVEIASITGHKTMDMLKRYAHLRAARLADRLG